MADKKVHEADEQKKIRVTITSRDVKSLEGFTSEMIKMGNEHGQDVRIKGPVRMPTKHLKMTVRKSPCGEGSKTWDRYEMRVFLPCMVRFTSEC